MTVTEGPREKKREKRKQEEAIRKRERGRESSAEKLSVDEANRRCDPFNWAPHRAFPCCGRLHLAMWGSFAHCALGSNLFGMRRVIVYCVQSPSRLFQLGAKQQGHDDCGKMGCNLRTVVVVMMIISFAGNATAQNALCT